MPPLLARLGEEAGHADGLAAVEGAEGVPAGQPLGHDLQRQRPLVGRRAAERLGVGVQRLQPERAEDLGFARREGTDADRVAGEGGFHGSNAFSW
ncbi:hypothetical protein STHU_54430 [Allostella humosa]|nr:hypothetical protein STHU_54430 [Stella humosa]